MFFKLAIDYIRTYGGALIIIWNRIGTQSLNPGITYFVFHFLLLASLKYA